VREHQRIAGLTGANQSHQRQEYQAIRPGSERVNAVLPWLSNPIRNVYIDRTPGIPDCYVVQANRLATPGRHPERAANKPPLMMRSDT
jgi:hypothetical protein